jgi:hypothetical protein
MRCLLIVLMCTSLYAQHGVGTIIVVGYSPRKVVFAADSRQGQDGKPPYKDVCKLTALNHHVGAAKSSIPIPILFQKQLFSEHSLSALLYFYVQRFTGMRQKDVFGTNEHSFIRLEL